jgi:uncharacterized protein (DUF433 family)
MTLLETLHLQRSPTDVGTAGAPGDSQSLLDDYDRLNTRQVVAQLAQRSQSELASIETHERSHEDRPEVLNKLRYLRGDEPLPDYDTLDAEQISTALDGADLDTAKLVREYERKFKRRSSVIDAVMQATKQTTSTSIRTRRDNPAPSGD